MSVTIAIDLGGTLIKLSLVDNGKPLEIEKIPVDEYGSLKPFLPIIETKVADMADNHGIESSDLSGIAMAFPSIVDNEKGIILSDYVKYRDINDLKLKLWAKQTWNIPLLFENDARAALIGEWQYGAGQGKTDLVLVTIGTGFGSAVLMKNKILRGKHYLAGNLGGHLTIKYDGKPCNCGNIGCLETVSSTWALPEKVTTHAHFKDSLLSREPQIDFEAVFRLAAGNDSLATSIRDESIDAWGFGLINLVHCFDPEMIIVGGGIMKSKEYILPIFQEKVDTHTWLPSGTVEITAAENEHHAALLGLDYLVQNTNTWND